MSERIGNLHVRKLFALSERDESVLALPLPDEIFGFHAQQSCEKLLKALLSSHGVVYPLTHSLVSLTRALEKCGEPLPPLPYDILRLDPFAVTHRYDSGPKLTPEELASIRNTVLGLKEHVLERILALELVP